MVKCKRTKADGRRLEGRSQMTQAFKKKTQI